MTDLISTLFGEYTPVTYSIDGSDIIPSGVSGLDWPWISGVFLFALSLYCVFRLIGGLRK